MTVELRANKPTNLMIHVKGRLVIKLKEYKIFHSDPSKPLKITQDLCNRVSCGLKEKMNIYYRHILPKGDAISDSQIYLLSYLNSSLDIIKDCKGFQKHISEYQNNPESAFFVTLMADILIGHGLKIELEPDIDGHDKKPDLLAFQETDGLTVFFECKQPKNDTNHLLPEQRRIFDGIEDVISDNYSLAVFYSRELSSNEISSLRDLIKDSLETESNIWVDRCVVDDSNFEVKVLISGIADNIERKGIIEISGIPNFSDAKGFTNINGINRFGKNIVFLKASSKNTINSQLKNSKNKIPIGMPFVVCIDLSGPKYDINEYSRYIQSHFEMRDHPSFSGVLLVEHGLVENGHYSVHLQYIPNPHAVIQLPFMNNFLTRSLVLDINSRYTIS